MKTGINKLEKCKTLVKDKNKQVEKYKQIMVKMKIGYMKELNSLREMLKAKQNLGTLFQSTHHLV